LEPFFSNITGHTDANVNSGSKIINKKTSGSKIINQKKTTEARSGKDSFLKICFLNIQEESFWRVN
jgi:hypothetical protein